MKTVIAMCLLVASMIDYGSGSRVDCGWYGIDSNTCATQRNGCVFKESKVANEPWCFYKEEKTCSDGDVQLRKTNGNKWTADGLQMDKRYGTPYIFWKGQWEQICPQQWNQHSADAFCRKLDEGHTKSGWDKHHDFQRKPSFMVGKCHKGEHLLGCTGGCNHKKVGGECVNNYQSCNGGQYDTARLSVRCMGGNESLTESCLPSAKPMPKIQKKHQCRHRGDLQLACPAGKVIKVLNAFHGYRKTKNPCHRHCNSQHIGHAWQCRYCYRGHSTSVVRSACQCKSSCRVNVNDRGVWGHHCSNNFNDLLEVDYVCVEKEGCGAPKTQASTPHPTRLPLQTTAPIENRTTNPRPTSSEIMPSASSEVIQASAIYSGDEQNDDY